MVGGKFILWGTPILKKAEMGAWLSIAAYIVLSTFKLINGGIGNSEALRADGLNNLTDIIASVAVLVGLKIAKNRPMRIIAMAIRGQKQSLP